MKRTYIHGVKEKVGKKVLVKGWVQSVRDQGGIVFLTLRDVTGVLQIVVLKKSGGFDAAKELSLESVISVKGEAKAEKQAPGGYEVKAEKIELLSAADPELPIPVVSEKGGEEVDITKRFDWRHIDLRKPDNLRIFRVWTSLEKAARKFWEKNKFIQIYTPSLMGVPSESGSEVFEVSYFDKQAYLAQSPQYYKQAAMAAGFEKVFMVGPVFRAEPSFTTRHMTEFTGWDYEISFIDSHHDVMDLHERFVLHILRGLKKEMMPDLYVQDVEIPRITMKDVKKRLSEAGVKTEKEGDLSPEEEREISRIVKKETGSDFVFLTDYPFSVRPYYHMCYEDDNKTTKSFDLLYRGIEITTGAQREHRYDVLLKQAKERKMNIEKIEFYTNFFKFGCPPHGGIGFGPGRFVMMIMGLSNVKEATFLPRDVKRLSP